MGTGKYGMTFYILQHNWNVQIQVDMMDGIHTLNYNSNSHLFAWKCGILHKGTLGEIGEKCILISTDNFIDSKSILHHLS